MSFTTKIKRYVGQTDTLASGSVDTALTQAVDYTLSVVKSASPQNLPLFGRKVVIDAPLKSGYINGISTVNAGSGYSSSSTIQFNGGGGTGAIGFLTLSQANGSVITGVGLGSVMSPLTKTGSNYTSIPTVTVGSAGSGTGATFRVTAVIKDGMDLGALNIFDILKVERNGYIAEPSSADNKHKVSDTSSIYRALAISPVYITDFEGVLRIYPDASGSEQAIIYCISSGDGKTINDTSETTTDNDLVFGTTTSTGEENFPSGWKELVVLHASELCLIEKLGDMTLQLPTDLDDTTVFDRIGDVDLSITGLTQGLPTNFSQTITMPTFTTVTFPSSEIGDPLSKAQAMIDGTTMSGGEENESAQYWLLDEDEDMVGSTLSVAAQELNRANTILSEHQSELGNKVQVFNNEMTRYTSEIQKEAQRIGLDISEYQAELQDALQKKQNTLQEYSTNLGKKMSSYTTLIQKISTDYQWLTQQLQVITGKKQEFIQSFKASMTPENPQEKTI